LNLKNIFFKNYKQNLKSKIIYINGGNIGSEIKVYIKN